MKNRSVTGVILKAVTGILKLVYKFLKLFYLHIPALVLLVGVVLYFTGAMENQIVSLTVCVLLLFAVIYCVSGNVKRLFKKGVTKKKSKGVEIIETSKEPFPSVSQVLDNGEIPVYFAVKQNPNYVMAEYSYKYVLYLKTENGLVKVREDKK